MTMMALRLRHLQSATLPHASRLCCVQHLRTFSNQAQSLNKLPVAPHFKDLPQTDGRPIDTQQTPSTLPNSEQSLSTKLEESHKHEDWVMFHPVYTTEEVASVKVVHRPRKALADYVSAGLVRMARLGFDFFTGYYKSPDPAAAVAQLKAEGKNLSLQELREQKIVMDDKQWMARILFLESIAGVPGSAASVLRHLKSLRALKRDNGWIHTLMSEAENERMHLMSFLTIRQPGLFMRLMILGAQGVFFNGFFFSYLIAPAACHRFVATLEEEAVHTYTICIKELEAGRLPEWENLPAPLIAKEYWRLPADATMRDMLYAVRADECQHRFVNHTLANLKGDDVNPFAIKEADPLDRNTKYEYTREEALSYSNQVTSEAKARIAQEAAKEASP